MHGRAAREVKKKPKANSTSDAQLHDQQRTTQAISMTMPSADSGSSSNDPTPNVVAATTAAGAAAAAAVVASAAAAADSDVEEDEAEVEDGVAALHSAPIESGGAGASSPRSARPARTGRPSSSDGSSPPAALPPADLNHADLNRIRAALPKTSKLADKIVAERDSNGPFRSFHDLKVRVRGLGAAKVKLLQQSGLSIELAQAAVLQQNHAQQQTQTQAQQQAQQQAHIDSSLLCPVAVAPASPNGAHVDDQNACVSASAAPVPFAAPSSLLPVILPAVMSVPMSSSTPPPPATETMASPARPAPAAAEVSSTTTTTSSSSCCWSDWICCHTNDSPAKVSAAPNASTATHTIQTEMTTMTVASKSTAITTPDAYDDLERQLANMSIAPPPAPIPPVPADSAIPLPSRSQPTLRMGSWNLCHFSTTKAHQRATLSVVADVLIRQRYDVVVLLEVRSDEACQMLLAELNNPHRQLPNAVSHLQPSDGDGVGQWAYVLSDCVEYGSEAHALPSSSLSSPQQLVLEADIVEERISADGTILSSSHTHAVAHAPSGSALEGADDVLSAMSSLSLREETHVTQNGHTVVSSSTSTSVTTAQVTMANGFSTPAKKRASRALSPPTNGQHRRGSTGNSSGSNGSGFTPRRSHKKKEYYCFFYRRDRVELPHGCRLFQSKAAPNSGPTSPTSPCVAAEAHSWWRSPCYAVVRPLPSLLTEFTGASVPSAPASSLPLSWLIVALHVIWGDGEADVLHECSHLQHLYCSMAEHAATLTPSDASGECNCAVALVGDFNINASDADFTRHCLPATHYEPLILRPHATTFSSHRHACNLYDQCFIERRVLDALAPPSTTTAVASSCNAAAVPAGVVYFDTDYFPPFDASDAACAARCRSEAKKWVSDHRPIFVDVPFVGDVRGVASRSPPVQLPPIPVQAAPKAAPVLSSISPPSSPPPAPSDAANATSSSDAADAVPLSSLLSIIIVTSAIPIHPSTEVIDCVLHSFNLVPELRGVPIFIMADAPKQVLPDESAVGATADPNIFKRGVMTQSRFDNYRIYLQNLRLRYASRPEVRIVELATYCGFAWAVKEALESHVHTPFVFVCQHDYVLTMRVPIRQLVLAMDHSHQADRAATAAAAVVAADAPPGPINYVGFIHKRTQNYLHTMHRNMPSDMRDHPLHRLFRAPTSLPSGNGEPPLLLCPLLFWYDKQHLASSRYYREVVLAHPRLTAGPGRFVEDEFGVAQIEEVRAARDGTTMDRWAKFGSFLYYPDERGLNIALRHIHGRRFEQQRVGGLHRYLAPVAADEPHSDTDADADADARAFDAMFEREQQEGK